MCWNNLVSSPRTFYTLLPSFTCDTSRHSPGPRITASKAKAKSHLYPARLLPINYIATPQPAHWSWHPTHPLRLCSPQYASPSAPLPHPSTLHLPCSLHRPVAPSALSPHEGYWHACCAQKGDGAAPVQRGDAQWGRAHLWEGQRVRGGAVGLGQAGEEQRWRGQKRCGGVALRVQDWEAQVVPSSAEGVSLVLRKWIVLSEEGRRRGEGPTVLAPLEDALPRDSPIPLAPHDNTELMLITIPIRLRLALAPPLRTKVLGTPIPPPPPKHAPRALTLVPLAKHPLRPAIPPPPAPDLGTRVHNARLVPPPLPLAPLRPAVVHPAV